MDHEDFISLFINITSEKRFDTIITKLTDIINNTDNKIDYIITLYNKQQNLYDHIVKLNLRYYNTYDDVNDLFTLFSSKRRYRHNITNWYLNSFLNTIGGQLQGLPIMTSYLHNIYYFRNGHSNYFDGYKNKSTIAIKTLNNIYFLDDNPNNMLLRQDQLHITYIMNIFQIELNTKLPLSILQYIYSFNHKYKLIII